MTTSVDAGTRSALEGTPVRHALSPSRAGDFQTCPLLYRFRSIDRLPEPAAPAAARGTVVHDVLEHLFDLPPEQRTLGAAAAMLAPTWERLQDQDPRLADLFTPDQAAEQATWLASCTDLLDRYFSMEDPRWLEPAERELRVDHVLASGLGLGGIVDRLDVAPDGRVRVVDYKTGRSPSERFEDKALFQMKFYALVIWRTRGVVPTVLQLLYLGDRTLLEYVPDEADLLATERKVQALWDAIEQCVRSGDFQPRPGPLCSWCSHRDLCPAQGGTPPELPLLRVVPADFRREAATSGVGDEGAHA